MILVFKIKCDRMDKGWNYTTCSLCEHFTSTQTKKGHSWFCSLNNNDTDKYHFFNLWATELAIKNGVMSESGRPGVAVIYTENELLQIPNKELKSVSEIDQRLAEMFARRKSYFDFLDDAKKRGKIDLFMVIEYNHPQLDYIEAQEIYEEWLEERSK